MGKALVFYIPQISQKYSNTQTIYIIFRKPNFTKNSPTKSHQFAASNIMLQSISMGTRWLYFTPREN